MKKKKLIFISEALWVGGIETALVNLLNRLDYDRYDVTCLILRDYQDMVPRITPKCRLLVAERQHAVTFSESYRYKRLYNLMEEPQHASALRRLVWHLLRFLLRAPEMRLYARYVREQLADEQFDAAIIYSDRTAEVAVRAVQAQKFLMFYHHGAMRREYHDGYGYRKSEAVVAVSELLAERLRAFVPQYADKIIAIHNLVNVREIVEYSKAIPEIVFPDDCFNVVSCGRVAKEKGLDLAVAACAELVVSGYPELHWWIVGSGPAEAELRQQIQILHMENHIHMLGMQSNPYPYIRQADLFVQPSKIESFGLTVLEAMILGEPVLATRTDGASELISDGVNGKLCDISVQSIVGAIRSLIEHPEELERYRRELRNYNYEARNEAVMERMYALFDAVQ